MSRAYDENLYRPPRASLETPQSSSQNRVRITYADLTPEMKKAIFEMRFWRRTRALGEAGMAAQGIGAATGVFAPMSIAGSSLSLGVRQFSAYKIMILQREMVQLMKIHHVIGESEDSYPPGWKNSSVIASTHPIFAIARNGDLIFIKPSRAERARFQYQLRFPGKVGLNFWRWRGYLDIPVGFETYTQWIKRNARELVGRDETIESWRQIRRGNLFSRAWNHWANRRKYEHFLRKRYRP